MKTKVAVILNTNQLGGAERSIVEQLHCMKEKNDFVFFIPKLEMPPVKLLNFLSEKGFKEIEEYLYPDFIYKLSKRNLLKTILLLLYLPFVLILPFIWHAKFSRFETFYANGNKASFPVLAWGTLFRRRIKMYWHFRDFPDSGFFRVIKFCLKAGRIYTKGINLKLIANSHAVAQELKPFFENENIQVIYNLVGELPSRSEVRPVRTIGIVSMHAPWKGLHSVVWTAGLFENELKDLGIERIIFFGSSIYQTDKEASSYSSDIKRLSEKLKCHLIEWRENKHPSEIFSEIDLLIHPSIAPEPLGRVILEAHKAKVPVISTCLGGSGELIGDNEFGLKYLANDPIDLFQKIKAIVIDSEMRSSLVRNACSRNNFIDSNVKKSLKNL